MDYTQFSNTTHWVTIRVLDLSRKVVFFISWTDLPFALRMKYDWYFTYRAALAQVHNPKYTIQFNWGSEAASGRSLQRILEVKISSKKGLITKWVAKLEYHSATLRTFVFNYCSIFDIEQNSRYIVLRSQRDFAQTKIDRAKDELDLLISQLKSIK